jgi:CheY-like chemotaxis protein
LRQDRPFRFSHFSRQNKHLGQKNQDGIALALQWRGGNFHLSHFRERAILDLCRHILLVDDDGYRRRDHAFLLQIGGFEVQTLNTPMEALNWFSITRTCPSIDLILMEGFWGLLDDRKVFEAIQEVGGLVPVLIVDRDPMTGKQIIWSKFSGEQSRISVHQRPQMITDIVRRFIGAAIGGGKNGEMARS